jgi:predicted nuclease of predicted toxin-antitoxin system
MIFWIDAQLPPNLAKWLNQKFGVEAYALRDLGLRDASDITIFQAAKQIGAVILTKDSDFVDLAYRFGTPPQILWLTCGNVTNQHLMVVIGATFFDALKLLNELEPVIEIGDI